MQGGQTLVVLRVNVRFGFEYGLECVGGPATQVLDREVQWGAAEAVGGVDVRAGGNQLSSFVSAYSVTGGAVQSGVAVGVSLVEAVVALPQQRQERGPVVVKQHDRVLHGELQDGLTGVIGDGRIGAAGEEERNGGGDFVGRGVAARGGVHEQELRFARILFHPLDPGGGGPAGDPMGRAEQDQVQDSVPVGVTGIDVGAF